MQKSMETTNWTVKVLLVIRKTPIASNTIMIEDKVKLQLLHNFETLKIVKLMILNKIFEQFSFGSGFN